MEEYGRGVTKEDSAQGREVILLEHPVFLHCYLNCHSVTIVVTIHRNGPIEGKTERERGVERTCPARPISQQST